MGKAELNPKYIPVAMDKEKIIDEPVQIDGKEYNIDLCSDGKPATVSSLLII